MIRTRHEFLDALHGLLQPDRYLEIGVWFGTSLRLTRPYTSAIGVDPNPLCTPPPNAVLATMTSDDFFAKTPPGSMVAPIDFGFIDGSHLFEDALRDVIGMEGLCGHRSLIALDDVLPYSPDIANRVPLPGDWAGDVWKLWPVLVKWRPDLKITMVDVEPTGLMVLQGLDPAVGPLTLSSAYQIICDTWARDVPYQQWIINGALPPDDALRQIQENQV